MSEDCPVVVEVFFGLNNDLGESCDLLGFYKYPAVTCRDIDIWTTGCFDGFNTVLVPSACFKMHPFEPLLVVFVPSWKRRCSPFHSGTDRAATGQQ